MKGEKKKNIAPEEKEQLGEMEMGRWLRGDLTGRSEKTAEWTGKEMKAQYKEPISHVL